MARIWPGGSARIAISSGSVQQEHANVDIPSFREIANQEAQTEGSIMAHIMLPKHPMPTIPLTTSEIADLAAYIMSLRDPGERSEPMKKAKIWYVIADGGRARFVERDENGAFRTVLSFVAADLHKRSRDLGRDRPARVKESANSARHAVEPRRDLHEAAKEDFVKLVAEQLEAEHGRGQFDRLVLVAPPGVLTELKQSSQQADCQAGGGRSAKGPDQGPGPRSDRAPHPGALASCRGLASKLHF